MFAILAIVGALSTDPSPRPSPTATPLPVMANVLSATPRRYCIRGTKTGSRITRQDCRTRAEWMDRGFDPLVPQE